LPRLRSLTLPFNDFGDITRSGESHSSPAYSPQLHSLKHLELRCNTLKHGGAPVALKALSPTQLRSLTISSFCNNLSALELGSLFSVLTDHRDPAHFQSICFDTHAMEPDVDFDPDAFGDIDPDEENTIVLSPVAIRASVFRPLFSGYHSLESVILLRHVLDADDAEMEELASHLPTLRHFITAFFSRNTLFQQPRMTLQSVLSFLTHCRSLCQLSLCIEP